MNKNKVFCEKCKKEVTYHKEARIHNTIIDNMEVAITLTVTVCDNCGNEVVADIIDEFDLNVTEILNQLKNKTWRIKKDNGQITDCICPNCGFNSTIAVPVHFKYCPECGTQLAFWGLEIE